MELNGQQLIAAPRADVWRALTDPDVLRACIPGCSELSGSMEEGFEATVTQKVGPVKATFSGKVSITDVVDGESYRIEGSGKGGAAGFASGGANVSLADAEDGTELSYTADAKVGGKLAQIGSRLVQGAAAKISNQFFENFKAHVEGGAEAEAADEPAAEPAENADEPAGEAAGEQKKGWWRRLSG